MYKTEHPTRISKELWTFPFHVLPNFLLSYIVSISLVVHPDFVCHLICHWQFAWGVHAMRVCGMRLAQSSSVSFRLSNDCHGWVGWWSSGFSFFPQGCFSVSFKLEFFFWSRFPEHHCLEDRGGCESAVRCWPGLPMFTVCRQRIPQVILQDSIVHSMPKQLSSSTTWHFPFPGPEQIQCCCGLPMPPPQLH